MCASPSTSAATSGTAAPPAAHACPGSHRQRAAAGSPEKAEVLMFCLKMQCHTGFPVRCAACWRHGTLYESDGSVRRRVSTQASNSSIDDGETDNTNLKVLQLLKQFDRWQSRLCDL